MRETRSVNSEEENSRIQKMARFVMRVWQQHDDGYTFISVRCAKTKRWDELCFGVSDPMSEIEGALREYSRLTHDLYFCPNAFDRPARKRKYALPTCWGWVDIDDHDVRIITPTPSILWQTSPGRTQALWRWDREESVTFAEMHSQLLSRRFGDPNGWSITKYLRIPFSINHKPQYAKPTVELLTTDWRPISARPPMMLRMSEVGIAPPWQFIEIADIQSVDRNAVIKFYAMKVHPRARALMREKRAYDVDRSKSIFEIVAGLHEAKAAPREIAAVLWGSACFISKHGQNIKKLNSEIQRIIAKQGGSHDQD
jgi:hypothetical protein